MPDLQAQLDRFAINYNQRRPHRALGRQTPALAYAATIKAQPAPNSLSTHYRVRFDTVDRFGKLTLRRAGKLHHLGVGHDHAGQPVLILVDQTTATVTHLNTGEVLGEYGIDPDNNYWRNQTKGPGRWPSPS